MDTPRVPRTDTVIRVPRDEVIQPPGYDEVIASTRYPVLRTETSVIETEADPEGGHPDQIGAAWKLKFVDFTPHLAGNNTRRHVTSFEKLLDRANTWLESNKHVEVKTCETVTWCAEDLRRLNDTDVVTTALKRGKIKKMHFMRGLRLWFVPRRESSEESITLGVREYRADVLDSRGLETFDLKSLVRVANGKLWESPISGEVINIETVLQPTRSDCGKDRFSLKVKDTYWTDGAKVDRKYIPIIRIFHALGSRNMNVEIGLTDIVPRVIKQSGRNRYEDLESLMVRASEWSVNQPHLRVTNLQTVTYKRRGFSQDVGYPVFWASADSEDACVRCVRIAYTKPRTLVTLRVFRPQHFCLRKKTFAPKMSPLSVGSSNETQPDDLRYESVTRTVEDISSWLDKTGVEVMNVETLRCHISNGRYHTQPDSSLVKPSDDKSREMITLIRIYLKANGNSAMCMSGPASLFNNPEDRPFWSRPATSRVARHKPGRRWRHALIVLVVLGAILLVAAVVVLMVAKAKEWI